MKCIYCLHDAMYPERALGTCPKCRKRYAFEPRTGSAYSDMAFKTAIDAVSANGSVRFLPEHVRYELHRRKRRGKAPSNSFFTLAAGSAVFALAAPVPALIVAGIFGVLGLAARPRDQIKLDGFTADWSVWCTVHGNPQGLIVRKQTAKSLEPYRGGEEMQQYSFDRAVICDRPETVDLLLANNFHFENNCAVLSPGGYPPRAFETVKAMLRQNPKLTVYVLHDATFEGCGLALRLASSPDWFKGRGRVVEVGIRPGHTVRLRGLWREPSSEPMSLEGITRDEQKWLARYSAELFAIRPEQVIKRLFKAITSDVDALSREADVWTDKESLVAEALTSDGGDDAFG
jgi:hypothetical protein